MQIEPGVPVWHLDLPQKVSNITYMKKTRFFADTRANLVKKCVFFTEKYSHWHHESLWSMPLRVKERTTDGTFIALKVKGKILQFE